MVDFTSYLKDKYNKIKDANRQAKEKKKQKAKVTKQMNTKGDRAPGSEGYKPTNTQIKSTAMVSRNVTRKGGTPYNEDMSNRITVTKPVGPDYKSKSTASDPSYNKAVQSPEPGNMEEGKKKMTGDTSLATRATQSAQDLLNPSAKMRRQKGY
jgi:hypothetical protein